MKSRTGENPGQRVKAGAYYFDGWSGQTNTQHLTERLRTAFADREPVWGWLANTVEILELQIDYAADHDLAFFAFCWYWPDGDTKETPLNQALSLYLNARNRARLEYCLLVANHAGFSIGPADWRSVCARWIALFKEPGYRTVSGRPLLIFFSPQGLVEAFGGAEATRTALNDLRQAARAAGSQPPIIAGCVRPEPGGSGDDLAALATAGFDLFTGYNYHETGDVGPGREQPFATMVRGHEAVWETIAARNIRPCIPVVTTGWDMRPWEQPDLPEAHQSVRYPDRTPGQVGDFVRRARHWMDQHPDQTVPERLLILYAWNENGEGGYLTPTRSEGATFLEAVSAALRDPETGETES